MRTGEIGVLAVQGAVREHLRAFERCGAEALPVKRPEQFKNLDGLVIPGGESTAIGKLLGQFCLVEPIRELYFDKKPIFGTCAGLALLASELEEDEKPILALMNIRACRNAFGRQRESFECALDVPVLGSEPFQAVFIRAPYISRVGSDVQVLASFEGKVVAARQGKLLVTSFHPELTEDLRLHRYFLDMI